MRISNEMREFLAEEVEKAAPGARVYLFGSRVHDEKRGGDIDILIMTDRKLEFAALSRIRINFWRRFGEQKLDLVNYTFNEDDPFKELIMDDAIEI